MAMFYANPYRMYWGPYVDPAPWGDWNTHWAGPGRWGGWGGVGPIADPAPFPMTAAGYTRAGYPPPAAEAPAYKTPASMYPYQPHFPPYADPAPYPHFPPYADPAPYPHFPLPPYADPAPDGWRWTAQLGRRPFPINVDPPPDDIRFRVDRFRDYVAGIFRDAGVNPDAVHTATVSDLVEAFKASQTPTAARTTAPMTVAQVASLDATGLERLRLQLESERHHVEALSKAVEDRQKATKGEARK